MDQSYILSLLERFKNGSLTQAEIVTELKNFPAEPLQDACVDHQRMLRTGIPEVIYGESKTTQQVIEIAQAMLARSGPVLATRISPEKGAQVAKAVPELTYHAQARMLIGQSAELAPELYHGLILTVCAGTSDIPVAEEARLTAASLGHPTQTLYDAGVAGLHRLLSKSHLLHDAAVIIVVAGMEGALPSVIGGLVGCPVIGVPCSVGYGTGTGGFAALLGMLNSCAPGLAVVNIDNGFGAGCLAASINRTGTG